MKNDKFFIEIKRLHDLGLALLWLHPKSKRPIETGWTTALKATWVDLKDEYRVGNNIGVRPGEASKIGKNYLACIDVDIKKPAYAKRAQNILIKLIQDAVLPEVKSGSGKGSRHLYCVTASPFKMITVDKCEDGEICIYSNGRQMVLPPSVHPTGALYTWAVPLTASNLPLLDFSTLLSVKAPPAKREGSRLSVEFEDGFSFTETEVEVEWSALSDSVKDAIIRGTGVSDRSGYLMKAVSAMLSVKFTHNEILNVLTDENTFLGKCAFEHAQTKNRVDAARWVWRYTLAKVAKEKSIDSLFPDVPEKILTPEEVAEQTKEFEEQESARANGFYSAGSKGALTPLYGELLGYFQKLHPFKTMADMKCVYVFNGTYYEHFTPIHIKAFAEDNFDPCPTERMRAEFYSKIIANNIEGRKFFTQSIEGHINFKNGILNLNEKEEWALELLPHSPDYGFLGVLPYEYDPTAQCPIFQKWLHSLMLGDEGLINILQEYMGYIIRGGEYRHHKALWLGGHGRNGKSTFVDLLKALIGLGNYSTISIKSLVGDKFVGADLDGKLANFSEETSPEELKDSGPFKNLTGDGDISAQNKFGDPFHFRNRAKLVMTYNEIPSLKDLSTGMMSRPLIIPFRKTIKENEQDRSIKEKLITELPGIFNFALEGWRRLERQNAFTKSKLSEEALKLVKEESCNVYQWAENYLEFVDYTPNAITSDTPKFKPKDLYAAYRSVEKYTFSFIEFSRRLNKHPRIKIRRKEMSKGTIYLGLKM